MHDPSTVAVEIRRAHPHECREVLSLCLATTSSTKLDLAAQVDAFLAHARATSLDLSRQWIATRNGRSLTACTCIHTPGRMAMLIVPPTIHDSVGPTIAARLFRHALDDAAAAGNRLVQCLFDPAEAPHISAFLQQLSFFPLARLAYMELQPLSNFAIARALPAAAWHAYATDAHATFLDVISQTYEKSGDCPALSGLRTVTDALEGHRAAGYFRPHRWLLLETHRTLAGCILLNEVPMRAALEVVYMGLVPDQRGRGLGYLLLSKAVELARSEGFTALMLAVDQSNRPAEALYTRAGFHRVLEKDAWLRAFNDAAER